MRNSSSDYPGGRLHPVESSARYPERTFWPVKKDRMVDGVESGAEIKQAK